MAKLKRLITNAIDSIMRNRYISLIVTQLQQRLITLKDSEAEQAINIRFTFSLALVLYFSFPWQRESSFFEQLLTSPSIISLCYLVASLLIITAILYHPYSSPIRRAVGICVDLVALSSLMFFSGVENIFMFVLYLWVILANGFRYGVKYLYFALAVGFVGFSIAITWGEYWQTTEHQSIGPNLQLILVVVSLYSTLLIKKLHRALDDAKEANEVKSRFLANMSHELRTPLNGVVGMVDLLGKTELNQQQYEFIKMMRSSADNLFGLIESVLDVSKIEAGKMSMLNEQFDLCLLLNAVINIQSPSSAEKNIAISCHINDSTPVLLRGSQQNLKHILVNLLGNAIKFVEKGNIKLFVSPASTNFSPESKHTEFFSIRFEVKYNDSSQSQRKELTRLFDDFNHKDFASSGMTGTKLGTAISKELIQLMGGVSGVEEESNNGSTFWFELPFEIIKEENLVLTKENILLLTSVEIAEQLTPLLVSCSVPYEIAASSARAFSMLMARLDERKPYKVLVVEQAIIGAVDPINFAKMVKDEPSLEDLSLVIIKNNDLNAAEFELRDDYISVIHDLSDKKSVLTALHAGQTFYGEDQKLVSRIERETNVPQSTGLHVLIAEDNIVNQRVIEGILVSEGHDCTIVDDGEQALDMILSEPENIDILILDMNLPELSGLEVLKSMQVMRAINIPVIVLTADATQKTKENCLIAGADVFLTKPIQSKLLLDSITSLVPNYGAKPAEISKRQQFSQEQEVITTPETFKPESTAQAADDFEWLDQPLVAELALLGDGDTFVSQLIKCLKDDGAKHIAIMKPAASKDYLRYRESVHALKGSSAELGATKLVALCKQAETLKPSDINTDNIFKLTNDIELALVKTLELLESLYPTADLS